MLEERIGNPVTALWNTEDRTKLQEVSELLSYTHPLISGSQAEPFLLFSHYLLIFKRKSRFSDFVYYKVMEDPVSPEISDIFQERKFCGIFCFRTTLWGWQTTQRSSCSCMWFPLRVRDFPRGLPSIPLHNQPQSIATSHAMRFCRKPPWAL